MHRPSEILIPANEKVPNADKDCDTRRDQDFASDRPVNSRVEESAEIFREPFRGAMGHPLIVRVDRPPVLAAALPEQLRDGRGGVPGRPHVEGGALRLFVGRGLDRAAGRTHEGKGAVAGGHAQGCQHGDDSAPAQHHGDSTAPDNREGRGRCEGRGARGSGGFRREFLMSGIFFRLFPHDVILTSLYAGTQASSLLAS